MTGVPTISGTMVRDALLCEHRVALDIHGDPERRDPVSPFVRMLWREGAAHEERTLSGLKGNTIDLRALDRAEREAGTLQAIASGACTILGAVIAHGDLVGMPDILSRTADGLVAGDVKSGSATEGRSGSYRREYLVQVAHYAAILGASGAGSGDVALVVGRSGATTRYDLSLPLGRDRRSGIDLHLDTLGRTRAIVGGSADTRPALASRCGMCHWRSACREQLRRTRDLTLVAGLGRSLRAPIETLAADVDALATVDAKTAPRVEGVGADRLDRFARRARLLATPGAGPVALRPFELPGGRGEIDFDVESDPLRGIVYLHGFWHASADGGGEFAHFFAETPDAEGERDAFAAAVGHFRRHRHERWYHYSPYERTAYRDLQRRHPSVCEPGEIEAIFDPERCTDLHAAVTSSTDWPLSSYGLKSLARACGFEWEDEDPGGANSIEWYDRWTTTRDPALRARIVAYNRDDVRASARVREALRELAGTGAIAGFRRPW